MLSFLNNSNIIGNGIFLGNGSIIGVSNRLLLLNADPALIMYYTFEPSTFISNTFANSSKSSYGVGVCTGSATIDSTNSVVGTSSCRSSSSSSYVTLPNFSFSGNITISLWFKRTSTGFVNEWFWLCNNSGTYTGLLFYGSNNSLYFASSVSGNPGVVILSSSNFSFGKWYHVAIVCSTTGTLVYVNASQVYSSASNAFSTVSANTHTILGWSGSDAINGNIDEFRIYSRVLSQTEINVLYERV